MAIIALLCCWPFAIPALMNATQVENKWRAGDQAGAIEAANQAKKWSTIAIGVGVAGIVLYILCFVILGAGAMLTPGGQ
jgi:predicted MFS family arabinose efflux permease